MKASDLFLYLATDSALVPSGDLVSAVEAAIAGGVTMVQLREKGRSTREVYEIGCRVLALTRKHGVPLIINDRVDLMLALGADGVHVGRGDLPLASVRRLARGKIVGYSVNAPEHLEYAESAGADYVGIGPVFATATKCDTGPVLGIEGVRCLVAMSSVPCVAIGGIGESTIADVLATGVAGCCVISAILGQEDIRLASRHLREVMAGGSS